MVAKPAPDYWQVEKITPTKVKAGRGDAGFRLAGAADVKSFAAVWDGAGV